MFLINSPGLPPLQPCFHGPLGALPLFSSTCGSWAFISSFQNHTRPGPGLPCAQEAWGLSPAAPGGPHVSPLRRGSAAGAGLPGAEAAGPPRTRVSFTSSLTKPEKAAHRSPPCEWGSSGKTQAWGWGRGAGMAQAPPQRRRPRPGEAGATQAPPQRRRPRARGRRARGHCWPPGSGAPPPESPDGSLQVDFLLASSAP